MASDIFEQLADTEVPPAPVETLEQGFNERLNNRLVVQHLVDLALRGVPFVAWHMLRGMLAVLFYTVAGKFFESKSDKKDPSEGE
jgi:hypothetical protein